MAEYKFKVNRDLLDQFFLSKESPTEEQLKEIEKVLNIVMIKHFSAYMQYAEDLKSFALISILNRRDQYDPSFSSYNYIYTIFRNEVGNKINKLTKETYVDDILKFRQDVYTTDLAELPSEILKYKEFLTGEKDFTFIRIPKKDVVNLLLFLKLYESRRDVQLPEFLEPTPKVVKTLYKLLKDMIEYGK